MARYPSTVMVSAVCPWDRRERLAEAVFRRTIRHALASGFRNLYVFGTAGEGYAVDGARFREVIGVFAEETAVSEATPIVGVIGLSTANVLERLRIAHGLGFREFQISLPSWSPLGDIEVLRFFRDVCGAFPDARFMHYNTARTGRVLAGTDYRPIIETVPNLVATKTMTSDLTVVASVVRDAPELMHFLSEQTIVHGSLHGDCALLGTYGLLAPRRSWALLEAVQAGRHLDAARIGAWFTDLNRDLLGPLLVDRRVDGAYDKVIARLSGLDDFPLRMLSPYRTVSNAEYRRVEQVLRERYPDCA